MFRETRSPLLTSTFIALVAGQGISLFGNTMLRFAMSMWVLDATGSPTAFATVLAVSVIPTIIIGPFGGVLADRINRRTMMVGLDVLSGIVTVLSLIWITRVGFSITVIAGVQITLAVLDALETPTVQAALPQMFKRYGAGTLRQGMAVINQVQQLSNLIPSFIGGILYACFGIRLMMTITALCFAVAALVECRIHLESPRAESDGEKPFSPIGDLRIAFLFLIREQPALLRLIVLCAWLNFILVGFSSVSFPFIVRNTLGFDAAVYGTCDGIVGIAGLIGTFVAGVCATRLRPRHASLSLCIEGLLILPPAISFMMPVDAWTRLLVLTGCLAIGMVAVDFLNLITFPTIQFKTPESMTGKVMALVTSVATCSQPLGQMAYGWLHGCLPVWLILLGSSLAILPFAAMARPMFDELES
ncbi:MFS transporter [Bifidobacterium dentium]|uniref:MFS transporter n=1 Tax=Bifidobacterium dentium TaxID=1689 RepID=UPI0013B81E7D|nr:MFS transporter [Bifidobacterium dentium]MBF9667318.1 MFS transporter [Bifidobacterium dentium]MBF9696105.1 MFS transporter [Bifidobacterium dentium]MBF9712263.1 MFS transporter [Bifidobacterium dentium]MBF9714225.1 MFS transporter [Bifidobacterium dentium]MBF9718198.1 MFS transporter [Bifidobacterium dentium]